MNMRELLGAMEHHEEENNGLPEAQIMELEQFYDRYQQGCPFEPGDLVMPRKNSNVVGHGKPHKVLEVREGEWVFLGADEKGEHGARGKPDPIWTNETSSTDFGRRVDMRVATIRRGHVVTHWVESVDFEPYRAVEMEAA